MLNTPEITQMLEELGWDPHDFTFIKQVSGNTNHSFICQYHGNVFIYRQAAPASTLLSIDRSKEFEILTALNNWQHANHPVYYNVASGNMLCPYISGNSVIASVSHTPQHLVQTANLLHELHQHRCSRVFNPFSDIAKWHTILLKHQHPASGTYNKLFQQIMTMQNKYNRIEKPFWGLCHNDCYNSNFISTPQHQLYLIDYEYAGMGDIFFDLACVCSNTDCTLSTKEQEHLVTTYFGYYTDYFLAKLQDYVVIQLFWNSCLAYVKGHYQPKLLLLADQFLEKAQDQNKKTLYL